MSGEAAVILGAAMWRFESPGALLLLLSLPLVVGVLWIGFVRRRRGLVVFAGSTEQSSKPGALRAGVKIALVAMGMASLMIALARPQADPVEESVTVRGRDVVFIVDVSKSMLSRDSVPNRLGRAKLWINDLVNTLGGDRVGLVAFAGAAVVKSPLTMDYGFFRMALDELSPASVPRGGTLIGDAIRKAMSDVFEPGPGRYRDIVLITDGEDQGSFPAEAAKQAAEQGVRLIVIGIGSEVEGAPVPSEDKSNSKYLEYQGERVRSRLDQTALAAIAEAASRAAGESGGGGIFLNVGTGTIDLDKVYHDLVGSAERRETETKSSVLYRELFPYFLALAGLGLAIEPAIGGRTRVRRRAETVANGRAQARTTLAAAMTLACVVAVPVRAAPAEDKPPEQSTIPAPASADFLYNTGRDLFLEGKFAEASDRFRLADLGSRDTELSALARFNLGQSLLKQAEVKQPGKQGAEQIRARLEGAARAFRSVLDVKPGDAEAARNVEIARRLLRDFEQQQEEQQSQEQSKDEQSQKDDSKDQQQDQDQQQNGKPDQKNQAGKQSGASSEQHQQNADDLKDLAEKQSRAADQSKKAAEQQDAAARKKEQQQAQDDQDQVNQETKAEQQEQKSGKTSEEKAKQHLDDASKEQQAATEALKKGDEKTAESHQRKAAELLNEAAKAEQEAAEQAKRDKGKNQDQDAKAKEPEPKYDQTASQLLDKERRERDARQQVLRALRGRPVPVEKDW